MTLQQEAQIYCIRNGHGKYVWTFFGYVHCGRCGQQIGDQLGGVFDTTDYIIIDHDCKICNRLKEKLSDFDKIIVSRLEQLKPTKYDYEQILQGIQFT